jgi:hypothetical protein
VDNRVYEEIDMDKDSAIKQVIEFNIEQCQNDVVFNDQLLYDLLMYGTKGLVNMTDDELQAELSNCSFD